MWGRALLLQDKITTEGFELEYFVGKDHIERELASTSSLPPLGGRGAGLAGILPLRGSNRLTSGGPTKNRTWN